MARTPLSTITLQPSWLLNGAALANLVWVGTYQVVEITRFNDVSIAQRSEPVLPLADISSELVSATGLQAALGLFGNSRQSDAGLGDIPVVVAEAPATSLNLLPEGVAATAADGRGYAIVADPAGGDQRHRVGNTLPGDATLIAVLQDRVIISNAGRHKVLPLPETGRLPPAGAVRSQNSAVGIQPVAAPTDF